MAKKQRRIRAEELPASQAQWLGKAVSVLLKNGQAHDVYALRLEAGILLCQDKLRLKHSFAIANIKELILQLPVAEC